MNRDKIVMTQRYIEERKKENSEKEYIYEINEYLTYKLCKIDNPQSLIDIVQIGKNSSLSTNSSIDPENQEIDWVKCHFKSGKTYVFTSDSFVEQALKSFSGATFGSDIKTLQQDVKKRRDAYKGKDDSGELSEDEKEWKSSRDGRYKFDITISPISLTKVDSLKQSLKKIFDTWLKSIDPMRDQYGWFPEAQKTFKDGFMQVYSGSFQKIFNDEDLDIANFVMMNLDVGPVVFYNTGDMNVGLGTEVWSPGFIPIAYTGKKCTKVAKDLNEIDDMTASLQDLDKIEIPQDDEDSEEIKFEKALERNTQEKPEN